MSDADRLRAAADAIDRGGPCPGCYACSTDRATAALLRAVADDIEYDDHAAWQPTQKAAAALADVILGGGDD